MKVCRRSIKTLIYYAIITIDMWHLKVQKHREANRGTRGTVSDPVQYQGQFHRAISCLGAVLVTIDPGDRIAIDATYMIQLV